MNSQSISKKIVTEDKNFLSLESVEKFPIFWNREFYKIDI